MTARYPLWCVDREGIELSADEHRYLGPFDTEALAEHEADEHDQVRRCRRVKAGEIPGLGWTLERLTERLDEDASGGELPDGAWVDSEDTIVKADPPPLDAFKAWLDAHVVVKAFVCEGDEPGGEG